jgi:hypothetical protein
LPVGEFGPVFPSVVGLTPQPKYPLFEHNPFDPAITDIR